MHSLLFPGQGNELWMPKCHKCGKKAIVYQKYSGMLLCQTHFDLDVNRKIRESLRRTNLFAHEAHIAIALSGGSDSATLLFALKSIFSQRRDIEFTAIILDEGSEVYWKERLAWAKAFAIKQDVPFITRSIADAMEVHAHGREAADLSFDKCSIKESILQRMALDLGANALAMGHTLDDEALSVFLHLTKGTIDGLSRLQPSAEKKETVPIMKPLRRIPAKETRLFAIRHELASPFASQSCSSSPAVSMKMEAERMLDEFDLRHPGTKYSLLCSLDRVIELQDRSTIGPITGAKPLCEDGK
jgi:tRNA(Ile)-lysidine synthase TilS/MesJ